MDWVGLPGTKSIKKVQRGGGKSWRRGNERCDGKREGKKNKKWIQCVNMERKKF